MGTYGSAVDKDLIKRVDTLLLRCALTEVESKLTTLFATHKGKEGDMKQSCGAEKKKITSIAGKKGVDEMWKPLRDRLEQAVKSQPITGY